MNSIQVKSSCCNAKIYSHGDRRRQCSSCKKTWSIRKKKRGRKTFRVHPNIENSLIYRKESLRHKADRTGKNREVVRRRHIQNLDAILRTTQENTPPPGNLIAIIDGWRFTIDKKVDVVYLTLLRGINDSEAIIMDPVVLQGYETNRKWEEVFNLLPKEIYDRIIVVVSDGLTGIDYLAKQRGWIHQRCHFHILKTLQSLRGKRWSTIKHKGLREEIYQTVRQILEVCDDAEAQILVDSLKKLLENPDCPKWMKLRVSGFLRYVWSFRSYRNILN